MPALSTWISRRPFITWRKMPSAMGLRQIFPVHTKRMVFITALTVSTWGGLGKSSTEKSRRSQHRARMAHDGDALDEVQRASQNGVAHDRFFHVVFVVVSFQR